MVVDARNATGAGTSVQGSNADIINMIRDNSSLTLQERVPKATRDNIKETIDAIFSYAPTQNEFVDTMMNKVVMQILSNKGLWENKFKVFKRGELLYGDTIEDAFIGMAKAERYNPSGAETTLFKRVKPRVNVAYHKRNRQDLYTTTVQGEAMRAAFLNEGGLSAFINEQINSLYNGAEWDEFLLMKELIAMHYELSVEPKTVKLSAPVTDEKTAKELLKKVRSWSANLGEFRVDCNTAGVETFTPKKDLVFITTNDVLAELDVEALMAAFNLSKGEIDLRIVTVAELPSNTLYTHDMVRDGVQGILCDALFFAVWDNLNQLNSVPNQKGLYENYFLHVWQVLSYSPFANVVYFLSGERSSEVVGRMVTELDSLTVKQLNSKLDEVQYSGHVPSKKDDIIDKVFGEKFAVYTMDEFNKPIDDYQEIITK